MTTIEGDMINRRRRYGLLAALPLLAIAEDPLTTSYERELPVRVEIESTLEVAVTQFEVTREGEVVQNGMEGENRAGFERSIVFVDHVLEHADDRPTLVRRHFEEIASEETTSSGGEEDTVERECPLSEVTIEIELDEDGTAGSEVVSGSDPRDSELLAGHLPTLMLDSLLPDESDGSTETGDRWELESEVVRRALGLDLERAFFPREAREERGEGEGRRRGRRGRAAAPASLFTRAEWEGEATLEERDADLDGITCARISFELEASGEVEAQGGERRGRDRIPVTSSATLQRTGDFDIELEGELWFSLADRLPVHMELEGQLVIRREIERAEQGVTISIVQEGTYEHTVTITEGDE